MPTMQNTNRWETKELVTMALMCAISVILSFIEFPLIPGISWLKYDPSCVPAMITGFAYGPGAGVVVGIVSVLIHTLIMGDWVGGLMNVFIVLAMVLPSAVAYTRNRTFKSALAGLGVSVVVCIVVAIVSNLLIDPFYLGVPFEAVTALVVPALLPFNIVKSMLNSALTLVVYKSISNLITPKKNRVKGR